MKNKKRNGSAGDIQDFGKISESIIAAVHAAAEQQSICRKYFRYIEPELYLHCQRLLSQKITGNKIDCKNDGNQ